MAANGETSTGATLPRRASDGKNSAPTLLQSAESEAELSVRAIKWPVGLFGRAGEILSLEIPDSSTPLLLSRQTQKTLGAVLDFANEEVDLSSLGAYKQKTEKAQGGHFALDITAFPEGGHPGLRRADDNETTYNLDEIHHKEIDPPT